MISFHKIIKSPFKAKPSHAQYYQAGLNISLSNNSIVINKEELISQRRFTWNLFTLETHPQRQISIQFAFHNTAIIL